MSDNEYLILTTGNKEKDSAFLEELRVISNKYGIEFEPGFRIYSLKEPMNFGIQYTWSDFGIEKTDMFG